MAPDRQRIQQYLKAFDFRTLFIEELGWDTLREAPLTLSVDGQSYTLRPLVEKRGFKVYTCSPDAKGQVPGSAIMHKIERELTRHAYEHIIIYIDAAHQNQAWQWIKREPGKASASRLYRLHSNQSGELLSQKLLALAFSIEEEAQLGTTVVAACVRQALDAERVTKKFYDRFQKEHTSFLTFIAGISAQSDCEWYASLMLNRLMFVYFIQKKGLLATSGHGQLDGDSDYLSHKLKAMQAHYGSDQFYSFYRYFLLRLFHEGLSSRERPVELDQLLGNVPYLNGGLFDMHVLERDYPDIQIADEAFARIFAFFDEYQWHLDDRPLRNDREINPDVLGYIFEKYINQKQMGAYYTKEDITEYIGKNTIIPSLLEATEQKCLIAFAPDGLTWALLRDDPDRYIYEAVKKGCELPLPPEIAVGIDDVSQRGEWNKAAPPEYALPTEIWREVVARRARYEEVRAKLANGEISAINDLITYNLDMRQFAEDAITYSEGVDLLNAFYESLEQVTILDPTCGSGAFLFAALTLLEPLYEACLDRMQEMVAERDRLDALDPKHRSQRPGSYIPRFRDILAQVAKHPNRHYFILKSIIINNLYGVDIMEEATEICKLRLFLKLVAQIERFADIEPLPDIDFNIRAGNTLVGFATYAEAERAITSKLDFDNTMERIERKAQEVERSFEHFRSMQTAMNIEPALMAEVKEQVRSQLKDLSAELDGYLASEYGIDRNSIPKKEEYEKRFAQWRLSHQPFHWFVEFYGIMKKGGFDVIIGNPPYVEYSKVRREYQILNYRTENCSNLYAFTMERSFSILKEGARFGMIVQLSSICTDRMAGLQDELRFVSSKIWVSNYDDRPAKLFDGLEHIRASIIITRTKDVRAVDGKPLINTTNLIRWYTECRPILFHLVTYEIIFELDIPGSIPKIGSDSLKHLISKVREKKRSVGDVYHQGGQYQIYYYRSPLYWIRGMDFLPSFESATATRSVHHFKDFDLADASLIKQVGCLINSSLFYLWFIVYGNGRNVALRDIQTFPCDLGQLSSQQGRILDELFAELMQDYKYHSRVKTRKDGVKLQQFYPSHSKPIIDKIDRLLARHYGFTDAELDFIINYDIKYRMGRGDNEEGDEE